MRHQLCLRLLEAYRNRGEMLLQAREFGLLPQLTRQGSVSNDEAHVCIALYQNWSLFLQAEQWNHGLYRRCPKTPIEALVLIDRWVAAGSPRPLNIRQYADDLIALIAAITSPLAHAAADLSEVVEFVC